MTAWSEASHAPRIRARGTPRWRASPASIAPCSASMASPAPSAQRRRPVAVALPPGGEMLTGGSALRHANRGLHLPPGGRIERAHGEDALDVHVEGHLHLGL